MKKLTLSLTLLIFSTFAFAAVDLSAYELTPKQVKLLKTMEAQGSSEAQVIEFAKLMERENQNVNDPGIPPYTQEELYAVIEWAEGGAFATFASDAGVEFDSARYMRNCPNLTLFNFGRVTSTRYLRVDVLSAFNGRGYVLQQKLIKSPEDFRQYYLEEIEETRFSKYIIKNNL